jgi:hypothetical protein
VGKQKEVNFIFCITFNRTFYDKYYYFKVTVSSRQDA